MTAIIHGVVERTFRCTSAPPPHAPAAAQAQVRVVIRQHLSVQPRIHALLCCGMGEAGDQAAALLRRRLTAGKPCTAHGKWLEPIQGSMDLVLRGCQEIHTEEAACGAVRETA